MKIIKNSRIEELAHKWFQKTISPAEQLELNQWYYKGLDRPIYIHEDFAQSDEELRGRLYEHIQQDIQQHKQVRLWKRIVGAAFILMCMAGSIYLYRWQDQTGKAEVSKDVAPGGDDATLILSDGTRISLNEAGNGKLAEQAGISVSKTADGQLVYTLTSADAAAADAAPSYHIIETPEGGQYQVLLPDGTHVWLNAASAFRYPLSFAKDGSREVWLEYGEAYFEVAEDHTHPFLVRSDRQQTEVLGTHFNIHAYPDEGAIKTTLLSGAVKVTDLISEQKVLLRPGQQSIVSTAGIQVRAVGETDIILWKDGKFVFDNEPMGSVMRQIARWYKVRVVYEDNVQDVRLSGSVSRFEKISTLLEKLEQTGLVRFRRDADVLTVMKP